jgi:hypothetical protein
LGWFAPSHIDAYLVLIFNGRCRIIPNIYELMRKWYIIVPLCWYHRLCFPFLIYKRALVICIRYTKCYMI